MVFALAADQPHTKRRRTQQSPTTQPETPCTVLRTPCTHVPKNSDEFTCFDIWCVGLGPDTFNNLGDDLDSYKLLLDHSFWFHDIYNVEEPNNRDLDTLTKEMRKSQRKLMLPLTIITEGDEEDDSNNGNNGNNGDNSNNGNNNDNRGDRDDGDDGDEEDEEYEGMEVEE
jgi:hypothetical protein